MGGGLRTSPSNGKEDEQRKNLKRGRVGFLSEVGEREARRCTEGTKAPGFPGKNHECRRSAAGLPARK